MSIDYFTIKVYFFTVFREISMKFKYFAFSDKLGFNTCSLRSDEYPLIVNNTGNFTAQKSFCTDNVGGREDYYLIYVVRGEMRAHLDDRLWLAHSGDVILFPPNYRYRYEYDGKEPLEYFFVHFTGSYVEQLLHDCGFSPMPYASHTAADRRISDAFHRFFEHTQKQNFLQKQRLACALEEILLTVAQSTSEVRERSLEASLRMIHNGYHTEVSIPALAKEENLSHSRYIEIFRRQTGLSPTAYLIRLRMQIACDLLESTDLSIAQISRMVSYNDPHFFSKLFKKHVGISPKQYRDKAREA